MEAILEAIRLIKADEDAVFAHEQKLTAVKERLGSWYITHPKSNYEQHTDFFLNRHRAGEAQAHV